MANVQENKKVLNYSALVKRKWGKEYNKPDVTYVFSNGRKFYSSDRGETGVYKRD